MPIYEVHSYVASIAASLPSKATASELQQMSANNSATQIKFRIVETMGYFWPIKMSCEKLCASMFQNNTWSL